MNAMVNIGTEHESPGSADIASAAETPTGPRAVIGAVGEPVIEHYNVDLTSEDQRLAPLFPLDVATGFRSRWHTVQSSFVDDPIHAVRQGDALVVELMKSLAETFTNVRAKLEGELDQTDKASTETLRVELRRYRSFFERLLSV